MNPPTLGSAGMDEDRPARASRTAELAAIKARGEAGTARKDDLYRYLELSMANRNG